MEEIKSLIEKGNIRKALDLSIDRDVNCWLLKASHNNLEKQLNLGFISKNDFKREEAKITNKLIDLL